MAIERNAVSVIIGRSETVRSKPYRFRLQNGDFVLMETEWSTFNSRWTGKVEFVVGYHRLLEGPQSNIDVFARPPELSHATDEILSPEEMLSVEKRLTDLLSKVCEFSST